MNQVPPAAEKAVDDIREIPGHLLHPLTVRLSVDARNLHSPCLQLDGEEDEVAPESV